MIQSIKLFISKNLSIAVILAIAVLSGLYSTEKLRRVQLEQDNYRLQQDVARISADMEMYRDELLNREKINANIELLTRNLRNNFNDLKGDIKDVKDRNTETGDHDGTEIFLIYKAIQEAKDGKYIQN